MHIYILIYSKDFTSSYTHVVTNEFHPYPHNLDSDSDSINKKLSDTATL